MSEDRLRAMELTHKDLRDKIEKLEKQKSEQHQQICLLIDKTRELEQRIKVLVDFDATNQDKFMKMEQSLAEKYMRLGLAFNANLKKIDTLSAVIENYFKYRQKHCKRMFDPNEQISYQQLYKEESEFLKQLAPKGVEGEPSKEYEPQFFGEPLKEKEEQEAPRKGEAEPVYDETPWECPFCHVTVHNGYFIHKSCFDMLRVQNQKDIAEFLEDLIKLTNYLYKEDIMEQINKDIEKWESRREKEG